MALKYSIPLSLYQAALSDKVEEVFAAGILPDDFLAAIFDKVGVMSSSAGLDETTMKWSFAGSIEIDAELALQIPGLDLFKLIIGAEGPGEDSNIIIDFTIEYDQHIVISLVDIDVLLEIQGGGFVKALAEEAGGSYSFDGSDYKAVDEPLWLYSDGGLEFRFSTDGTVIVNGPRGWNITPFCVPSLNAGFKIDNAIFRLGNGNDLPAELAALGYDNDWLGVYCESFQIFFSEDSILSSVVNEIQIRDLAVGRGGFSGTISAGPWQPELNNEETAFLPGSGVTELFGFQIGLKSVAIEFKQNAIIMCDIEATVITPFFEAPIDVVIGIDNDGEFSVAVAASDGLLLLRKSGIIAIEVSSLEFLKEDDEFLFQLSGKVTPELAGIDWPSFELKALSISSAGQVKVEGGWIELPELKTLDFYGFKVEISQLGFGKDQLNGNDYNWIGFSGGIQIVQGLPLRGGVEGLKVMWGEVDSPKLKIGGVYLEFEIPEVLSFEGTVYFIDEEVNGQPVKEFRGGLDVFIIPINFGLSGQFIAGKAPDYNYFYIFMEVELPVGVPLGPPVLGLYGLAGLFGHNMTFDYTRLTDYPDESQRPDLTDAQNNWFQEKDALAFGAGLTVGTLPDVKFLVKAKAVFAILIPGPVILIEGHAGMISLGDSYQFRVLAVLDPSAGSFLMNISAEYGFPKDSEDLMLISGSAEAFFSAADPDDWHLYLGRDEPESKQIRADILSFFKARTYLMVDNDGLRLGAWIGYDLDEKYGILRVVLAYWMSGELALSRMPFQAAGSLTLYGNAQLSAGPVSLGISVEAGVSAQAPKPLSISAYLEVQLKTPLGNPKAKINLKWEKEATPPYALPLSPTPGIEHRKVTRNWDVTKRQTYNIDDDGLWLGTVNENAAIPPVPLVPPDVQLVLNFDKPVEDVGLVGDNPAPKPADEIVGDYKFKYALQSVTLQCRDTWDEISDDGDWEDYEDFAASQVQEGQSAYKLSGAWQVIPDSEEIVNTKLVLNATTPFEISRILQDNGYWLAILDAYNTDYPCGPVDEEEWTCVDFENRPYGSEYPLFVEQGFIFISDYPMNIHQYSAAWLGTEKAMNNAGSFTTTECLNIPLQEATGEIKLKVIDNVMLMAGIGGNAYIKFTDEFSDNSEIECFVDNLSATLRASIHFPEIFFPGLPYKVYITCAVGDAPGDVFIAYDEDLNELDTARLKSGRNEIVTYVLHSQDVPIRFIGILASTIRILEICYEKQHSSDISDILVVMPDDMVKAEVHFTKNSRGSVYLYDAQENEIETLDFDIPRDIPDDQVQPVELAVANRTFRSFLVSGVCQIIRVCAVTEEDHQTYLHNAGLSTHLQTRVEENWGQHSAQILHPNKYYRLQIETSASRKKDNDEWAEENFTEYMYFKTGNPPGPLSDLQQALPAEERYDQEESLKDLTAYIDYTIPAGAAANEPQPLIYRSYDVGVVYNDSYIDQMYQMADLPIKIRFLDNNHQPALNAAGQELELLNQWGDNPELATTREEEQYKDILDENGCIIAVEVNPESTTEIMASSRELLLSPQVQCRARVIAGESQPVYEFAFLTSRYANFLHHVHSFIDALWDHFALLDDPGYQIETAALQQVLANSEDEAVKFEQLMTLLALNPRPLPERVEVLLLNDGSHSRGLLFESPEPLDWERLEITLAQADKSEAVEEFDGKIKIIAAGIAATRNRIGQEDYNRQWVDLLVLETGDLSGYAIEHLAADAPEDETYQTFYTFTGSPVYNAGTRVRIYNGQDPGHSPDDVEPVYLYAGNQSQSFQPAGELIRLRSAEGEIQHTRLLYGEEAFTELDINLVHNQDGTRFFVFVKDGGQESVELPTGRYRLHFTFKRDIGSEHPVLKRFGFSSAEETFIEFSLPAFLP